MTAQEGPSTRKQALVAALQWGLVQTFILDTLGRLLWNYYRATSDMFFPPDRVWSLQFAAPLGLLIGGIGGYRWVTRGRAVASPSAHRTRVLFVGALVGGWALAFIPEVVFEWLLGDQLSSIPYFILPTVTAVSVSIGAYLLAYRAGPDWYCQYRPRLLGAVQGAVVGMLVGPTCFVVYGQYLIATQDNYSLDGRPALVLAVCLGIGIGAAVIKTERAGTRSAEFTVLLILSYLGATVLLVLAALTLSLLGISTYGILPLDLLFLTPILVSFAVAGYLAYGARTTLYRRVIA